MLLQEGNGTLQHGVAQDGLSLWTRLQLGRVEDRIGKLSNRRMRRSAPASDEVVGICRSSWKKGEYMLRELMCSSSTELAQASIAWSTTVVNMGSDWKQWSRSFFNLWPLNTELSRRQALWMCNSRRPSNVSRIAWIVFEEYFVPNVVTLWDLRYLCQDSNALRHKDALDGCVRFQT
jgi:hypothetical protein